jgi:hypothetical protein
VSSLLNKRKVKQFTLDAAKSRSHKFTRVGSGFYVQCETNLKQFIRSYIQSLPSKGKTIQ